MSDLERELVGHLLATSYDALTPEAERAARRELVWFLGTAVAGSAAPGSDGITGYVADIEGRPEATVCGRGLLAPAHLAAMANATFAKAYEFEDKLWIGRTHGFGIGMAVVPAVLALAEHRGGLAGQPLIAAIAAATDLHARLISAPVDATFNSIGWNSAYLFSNLGAVAGAARVLQLDAEQTMNAFGLAYAQLAGNYQGQVEGVLGVRLQAGFAVRNGIMAAQLAQRGLTGVKSWLTGRYGLFNLYFGTHDVDVASITADLGTRLRGESLGFKSYPCGLVAHRALDSLSELLAREQVDPSAVAAVRVFGDDHLRIMAEPAETRTNPTSFVEAQFSIAWACASIIRTGELGLSSFGVPALADTETRSLAALVRVDAVAGRDCSWVEIERRDGTVARGPAITVAHGHPDNPLSDEEIRDIYVSCIDWADPSGQLSAARGLAGRLLEDGDPLPSGEISSALRSRSPGVISGSLTTRRLPSR
jgi:2-methylcitrate dehydratase PrpD